MKLFKYILCAGILGWYIDAERNGKTFLGSSYKTKNRSYGQVYHK